MIPHIWCGAIEFYIKYDTNPVLSFLYRTDSQGILSFERNCGEHYLYVWYDEGHFPDFFDTEVCSHDNNDYDDDDDDDVYKLRIVGVDEV
jgi:hypothetical protein